MVIRQLQKLLYFGALGAVLSACSVSVENISLAPKSVVDPGISATLTRTSSDVVEAESVTTSTNYNVTASLGEPTQTQTLGNGYTVQSVIK